MAKHVRKVPNHATFHTYSIATGKQGGAPGELYNPRGVAIHEDTHQIFVADNGNHRVEIFSETGEYINQLGVGQLTEPYCIATHGDSIYVSCWGDDTESKFSLTNMSLVRKIGGKGSDNGQFNLPHQLTTDAIGRVFIVDYSNNRICVHDTDLNHLRNITHQDVRLPLDVKVSRNLLYVLCSNSNPCMHVLTLEGDKLRSLFTCGYGIDVLFPHFFCLDPLKNFVFSDADNNLIPVFSPEGNLLHTIGSEEHQHATMYDLRGVAITPNGRLICIYWDGIYGLKIF